MTSEQTTQQNQDPVQKAKKALESMGGGKYLSQADYKMLLREHSGSAIVTACNALDIKITTS